MIRRGTWLVLVIFVILLGVAFYLQRSGGAEGGATPTAEAKFLFDVDENADVAGLRIEADSGQSVALERSEDGEWRLTEPQQPADVGQVEVAVTQLLAIQTVTTIDPPPAPDATGMDAPAYIIKMTSSDGQESVARVGKKTPTGSGYYVQMDADGPVHVVQEFALEEVTGLVDNPPVSITPAVEATTSGGGTSTAIPAGEGAADPTSTP